MAFCSLSKDFDSAYTIVENKFITKYLPEADDFAVKVYLYGLFLCQNTSTEFGIRSMAEVLKTTEEKIMQAFAFWEDYDLVAILSKDPFTVQYLPVRTTMGKPKKIRYEQYADFNKELQRIMQKVGKFVSAGEYVKYMQFLEETSMQQQALLLVAEYCINKQGEAVSPSYIFNKARKLLRTGLSTYEQIEKELSNYNAHEKELLAVFSAMSVQRTPDETDYALYKKWTETLGFSKDGVMITAKKLKRGTMNALDLTLEELYGKGKLTADEIDSYLTDRETLANLTFRIGRKLGAKVQNPTPFIDEYTEKWYNYGFDENSLLDLALYCMKTERGTFDGMHTLVSQLFADGNVSRDGVKEFLKEKNDELKLFSKMQEICGGLRKTPANLAMVTTWRDWKFNDAMILEATKQSAFSSNPIPYMNKILSNWKRAEIYEVSAIPTTPTFGATGAPAPYQNAKLEAVNAKSDRERYYALLREKAQSRADKYLAKANGNARFKEITAKLSKMEIALAKAEVFEPVTLPTLTKEKADLLSERKAILSVLGIDEAQLSPQFSCPKCSDTGFLPSGKACNCYKPNA
ncbi:MAG: DnaD domain protein [Clostridia bacterium]|nr:DnaD domain protein [Clostridia bacterium]